MPRPPARRCSHLTRKGKPCQAWAVRGSVPPRCHTHGGADLILDAGANTGIEPSASVKLPCSSPRLGGDSDAPETGARAKENSYSIEFDTIAGVIHDLAAKQQCLSEYIDGCLADDSLPIHDLVRLLALHGQNASRLGRLLRDKRALSGEAADGISGAIAQALDELATEWGLEL